MPLNTPTRVTRSRSRSAANTLLQNELSITPDNDSSLNTTLNTRKRKQDYIVLSKYSL
jgi:hypothetical protein